MNKTKYNSRTGLHAMVRCSMMRLLWVVIPLLSSMAHALDTPPTGLTATAGAGGIVLNWTAPDQTTDTVGGYNVNRCDGTGCTPVYLEWVNGDSVTTYTDAAVTAGTLYRYTVSAYYSVSNTTSDQSDVVEEDGDDASSPSCSSCTHGLDGHGGRRRHCFKLDGSGSNNRYGGRIQRKSLRWNGLHPCVS